MNKVFLILFAAFLLLSIVNVQAFELEKHLVQLEVDENYPCHIESGDTIVCPKLEKAKIDSWKIDISNLKPEEKDKGDLTDSQKVQYLTGNIIPYKKGTFTKAVDITKEYREKVDIYHLQDDIKIGFNTNVFGVSGTPLENFDVNTTTGMVKYRPLNMTWIDFTETNKYVNFENGINRGFNYTISIWINTSSTTTTMKKIFSIGNDMVLGINGTGTILSTRNSSLTYFYTYGDFINNSLWHNIVATQRKETGNITLYIDGIFQSSLEGGQTLSSGTGQSALGGTSDSWIGKMDEFRFYDRIISSSEINEIYSSGKMKNSSINNTNLHMWASFNENSGTTFNYLNLTNYKTGTIISGVSWQSDGINVTTLGYWVNISIVNMSNALVFYPNGTLINTSLDGSKTFEFYNNDTIYILDEFEVNEGSPITNSPIWFTTTGTNRTISSNLTEDFNTSVIVSGVDCASTKVNTITYTSASGTQTIWDGSEVTDICTALTTTGYYLNLENGANELVIEYICSSFTLLGFNLIGLLSALAVLSIAVGFVMLRWRNGDTNAKDMIFLFVMIIIAVVLYLSVAQIIGAACP